MSDIQGKENCVRESVVSEGDNGKKKKRRVQEWH